MYYFALKFLLFDVWGVWHPRWKQYIVSESDKLYRSNKAVVPAETISHTKDLLLMSECSDTITSWIEYHNMYVMK